MHQTNITISGMIKGKMGPKADIPTFLNNMKALNVSAFLVLLGAGTE